MALSEHEQQLLEQMERALATEDPRFASALSGKIIERVAPKNLGLAVMAIFFGIAALIAGVALSQPAIGIVGFLVIVGGIASALSTFRTPGTQSKKLSPSKAPRAPFMQGLEERWDRRQDNS